jgi:uncharacterized protein YeaO (DUF488 family)
MRILVKRIYEEPKSQDGARVLVDRLWPRGLKKENAKLDEWLKDIAPSDELRKWFNHEKEKWPEFKKRYFKELDKQGTGLQRLKDLAASGSVTLLYSSKEEELNNAVALKEYLEKEMGKGERKYGETRHKNA